MNVLLAADTGGGYVAAAYLAFILMLAVYMAIMARKLTGMQRRLGEIQRRGEGPGREDAQPSGTVEHLD